MHHICEKKTIELIESLPSLMMPLGNFLTWISKNPKKQYKNQDPWKFHMIFLDSPGNFTSFFITPLTALEFPCSMCLFSITLNKKIFYSGSWNKVFFSFSVLISPLLDYSRKSILLKWISWNKPSQQKGEIKTLNEKKNLVSRLRTRKKSLGKCN